MSLDCLVRRGTRLALTLFVLQAIGASAQAQLPSARLSCIFPSGANPGATIEVMVAGDDLDDVTKLEFTHEGISATQKMAEPGPFDKGPQPVPNQFVVKVADNTPLGIYEARVTGRYGISNPRRFVIGDLRDTLENEPNDTIEEANEITAPTVINGRADRAADVDCFKLAAEAGRRILADCRAISIDSKLEPKLVVYDQSGRELASSTRTKAGDALLDFTPSVSGELLIKLTDTLFQGGADYFYRLTVGVTPHIDFVFPPAGEPGGSRSFTLFGRNLPGGQDAGLAVDGRPLQKLTVSIPLPSGAEAEMLKYNSLIAPETAGLDGQEYRLKGNVSYSNPTLIGYATAPVVMESGDNDSAERAQVVKPPCELAGQFFPRRDLDWFAFEAKKGERYTIEIISQRLGLDTDPAMRIQQVTRDDKGETKTKELAAIDDSGASEGGDFSNRCDDPVYRFEAPADGVYRVLVSDSYNRFRADPRDVYRLSIRPEKPDYRLAAAPVHARGAVLLRQGGRQGVRVIAYRRDGFDEPIEVSVSGLPAGVTCPGAVIGPGRSSATLILTAADDAGEALGRIRIAGKAKLGDRELTREARLGVAINPGLPRQGNRLEQPASSRLTNDLLVSVTTKEKSPVSVTLTGEPVWETSRGGIVKIPFKVQRGDFKGNVIIRGIDLPTNITVRQQTVNGSKADGQMELRLTAASPVGEFTLYFDAQAQNLKYVRNPEAAKAAAARKTELDKINKEAAAAAKQAATEKTNADRNAATAKTALANAKTAHTKAEQTAKQAEAALKTAEAKTKQAKENAQAKPDDENLTNAVKTAEQALSAATAQHTKLAAAADNAAKALQEAEAKAKQADEAQAQATKANEKAADRAKAAAAAKAAADKLATDTANAAKPRNRNVFFPSSSFRLKVAPAPIKLTAGPLKSAVKQGDKAEVPVSIERLFKYADQVTLAVTAPRGVRGVSIGSGRIAKGQTAAALKLAAAANATPGKHEFLIRATSRLNNQNVTIEQPVTVVIEKKEPAKK